MLPISPANEGMFPDPLLLTDESEFSLIMDISQPLTRNFAEGPPL